MSRSRVTLATIEAAAIEATSPSPPITAWQSQETAMRSQPSTKTRRGRVGSARTARAGADLPIELLARFRGELLGIVEPAGNARRIEDDRGGDDRPGERSPPRLVAARDRRDAAVDGAALPAERRTDSRLEQRQPRRGGG